MAPRDRLARLDMLARGEGAARLAIDKYLDARAGMAIAQPHVVRRAFIAERGGDGGMHRKVALIGEGEAKLRQRSGPFVAAVRHRDQIGDRQVAAPIGGVGGRGHGRGIGGPHRRGRAGRSADMRLGAGEIATQALEPAGGGPVERQKEALGKAEREVCAHLGHALQRCRPRLADRAGVAG